MDRGAQTSQAPLGAGGAARLVAGVAARVARQGACDSPVGVVAAPLAVGCQLLAGIDISRLCARFRGHAAHRPLEM